MKTYTITNSKGEKLRFATGQFTDNLYWHEGCEDADGYLTECLKAYQDLNPNEKYKIVLHYEG